MKDLLPTEEVLTPNTTCPICGSSSYIDLFPLQQTPKVQLRACQDCHASYSESFPSDEFLTQLYSPEHYTGTVTSDQFVKNKLSTILSSYCKPAKNSPFCILDYGGNDGSLSVEIKKKILAKYPGTEVRITVVDLYKHDIEGIDYILPQEFFSQNHQYDLVIASAVLEHLTNLGDAAQAIAKSLTPGGLFYARTPYEVPLAKVFKSYKLRWPRHLFDLGPQFWKQFPERYNMSGKYIFSRPSIVETSLGASPVRTTFAHILKTPAHIETKFLKKVLGYKGHMWHFVGGWEVLFKKNG